MVQPQSDDGGRYYYSALLEPGQPFLKLLGLRKEKTTKRFGRSQSEEDIRFIKRNLKVIDDVVLVREGGRNGWNVTRRFVWLLGGLNQWKQTPAK